MYINDKRWDEFVSISLHLMEKSDVVANEMLSSFIQEIINQEDEPVPLPEQSTDIPKNKRVRGHYGKNLFVFRKIPSGIKHRQDWIDGIMECVKKANEYGLSGVRINTLKPYLEIEKRKRYTIIEAEYSR